MTRPQIDILLDLAPILSALIFVAMVGWMVTDDDYPQPEKNTDDLPRTQGDPRY